MPAMLTQTEKCHLATTTSTQDSGLSMCAAHLREEDGYSSRPSLSVRQAMAMGKKGEADVLLVHSPAEKQVHGARETA
jgi:tungstate transport system substrate-binding protein